LSWTSSTIGSPKSFLLTHRNIVTNVEALQKLNVVGPRDRALPLPLHHAYPFIVGMLTTLTIGTAIVLPRGTTGPLLVSGNARGRGHHDNRSTAPLRCDLDCAQNARCDARPDSAAPMARDAANRRA
jgi:hypothetical protein